MKRKKASATIVAMVAVAILAVLSLVILQIISQSQLNINWQLERNRANWFLEGRLQWLMDGFINGSLPLKPGEYSYKEQLEGKEIYWNLTINKIQERRFILTLNSLWNGRIPIKRKIVFDNDNLFDYSFFVNGKMDLILERDVAFHGRIGANGDFSLRTPTGGKIYFFCNSDFTPVIDCRGSFFTLNKPLLFTNSPFFLIQNPDLNTSKLSLYSNNITINRLSDEVKIPSFDSLWTLFYPYRDEVWCIGPFSYLPSKNIINTLSSEKRLLAIGDGYSTTFDCSAEKVGNIYIRKINVSNRNIVDSLQYAYFYSKDVPRENYYSYDRGRLVLRASMTPVLVSLPDEAFNQFGEISLGGKDFSFVSIDERIEKLSFYKPSFGNIFEEGRDFVYDSAKRKIKMVSPEFFNNFTQKLGYGDGRTKVFPVVRTLDRFYFYIGGERTVNFKLFPNRVEFSNPPPSGKEITAMRSTSLFFIQKRAPAENVGIFTDREEKAMVIDFSTVQNYPSGGVILSTVPLLIRGESAMPIIVLSKENIYLQNLNPSNRGEPVLVASGKGVWFYKAEKQKEIKINRAIIYSPLRGLYTIDEKGNQSDMPLTVYGSVFLTLENEKGAMDFPSIAQNILYYGSITNYVKYRPFSLFPGSLTVLSVERN